MDTNVETTETVENVVTENEVATETVSTADPVETVEAPVIDASANASTDASVFDTSAIDLSNIDIDLDDINDTISTDAISNFGDVELTIDEPHIKVASEDLNRALTLLGSVIESNGNDMLSKAITFKVDNGSIIFKATNYTNYITYKCPVINNTNLIEESITINYNLLQKVTKVLGKQVAFIKKDNGIHIRLIGGDLFLETLSVDLTKYDAPGEKQEEIFRVEPQKLNQVLKDSLILINQAVRPEDRKVFFTPQGFLFNSILISLRGDIALGDLNLKKADIDAVKKLAMTSQDSLLYFYKVKQDNFNRVLVTDSKGCSFSFIADSTQQDPAVLAQFDEVKSLAGAYVDMALLYRYTELSEALPYSTQRIGLNWVDSNLEFTIITKRGDNKFMLQGSTTGLLNTLPQGATVQASQLRNLLQSFAGNNTVLVTIGSKALFIQSDTYTGVLRYS